MKIARNALTFTALAVMASFTMSLSAATKTWSGGGDGSSWNDPLNWENLQMPVSGQGDLVVLSNSGSTPTINNNLGAISIGKLSVTNSGNVALTGGEITFDGTQGVVIDANVSLQLSIANDLVLPISRNINFELPTTFTLTGDITSPTLSTSRTLFFFSRGNGRTAVIGGDVNLPGWDVQNIVKANSYVQFNGKLICGKVLSSGGFIGGDTGDFRLNCTESSFSLIRAGYSGVKCMRADVIDQEAIIEFGGYSETSTSKFDLNGYDQTVDRVRAKPDAPGYWFTGNFLKSSSAAKLTMNGTDNALACCEVDGAVTLVWNPTGSYETVFSNRVNTTTGDIIVSNGTFKVAGAATFANVKRVEVADGAAFVLDTTSASSLTSVTNVTVGADASFTIGASASAPFANSVMSLALDSDATFCIPIGITILVKELTIGGEPVEGGDYSGTSGLKQITGGGTLSVPQVEVETKAATWNAGALPDENVNTVGNWAGGFVLSDLTSCGLQPLFASAGTQAVFNVKTDFKGVKFGLPPSAETKSFMLKGGSGVTMTLRNLGIVMEEPGGNDLYRYTIDVPVTLKAASMMPWTLASSNATLSIEEPISGTTDITKTGGATVELRSPNPDFTGAFNFTAGKLEVHAVTNALGSAASSSAADINGVGGAVATFHGTTVDRAITVRCGTSIDSTKFMFADGTTNVLNGALSFLLASGTKGVGGFRVGSGTELVTTGTVLSDVAGMSGGGTWICRGPFRIYNFLLGSGTVILETTTFNRGDGVQPAMRIYQPDSCIRCTIPNQLNEDWNSLDIDNGTFDLNGCDQKFGGLKVNDANTVGGRIYSATPATLTIHGYGCNDSDFYLTKPDIAGAVSLRCPLHSGRTFTIDRAVSAIGSLAVPAGTFVFTANGSWLNGSNVVVEGTGVLKLNRSKTFNREAVIRVTDTGSIDLASGVDQQCSELWLGGNKCDYGTWGSSSSGAKHTSSMLTGGGIITIRPKGMTLLLL